MKKLIDLQRQFFDTGKTVPLAFRINQLNTLEAMLKANETELYDAIYKDFKKSEFETYASELAIIYKDIQDAKRNLYRWARREKVSTNLVNFPAKSYRISEPLGVCLVIGAWNYPYQLSIAPAVAAIAAGNTVIIKPSEIPSHTSAVMKKIISESFSENYVAVVEGGIPETTELLQQDFDKIFFTGSTKVGKIVYKAAAENMTPVTLELGGKSPAFITKGCNLKMAVKRLIWAKFLNAGQTCIAPDYVMVDEQIAEAFLSLCMKEIKKAKYAFENHNYVQIINQRNFERLTALLDQNKMYCGGKVNEEDRYMEPTILHGITFEDTVMREEIFGPILPVITYTSLEKAIMEVKKLPKPLSCYVFAKSTKTKKAVVEGLSFGGGAVNEAVMHITNPKLPFGGVGPSGIGTYHGKAGFDCFSHHKSILDKPTWLELPLKYAPLTKSKLRWIKRAMRF